LVVVEAQSSGVPVIGSRNGGIPEYISDTKTGFIFPQEDYEQLAEHLRTLYENPSLLREIKIAAREWIINNFSHLKQIEKHVTIYTK
jgi:glycosyltransferase involved in cell wall biosynthesis